MGRLQPGTLHDSASVGPTRGFPCQITHSHLLLQFSASLLYETPPGLQTACISGQASERNWDWYYGRIIG